MMLRGDVIDKSVCCGEVATNYNFLHIEKYEFCHFCGFCCNVCNVRRKQLMMPCVFSDNLPNNFSMCPACFSIFMSVAADWW